MKSLVSRHESQFLMIQHPVQNPSIFHHLEGTLLLATSVEGQGTTLSRECDGSAVGEVEDVAGTSLDLLASGVLNGEVALNDDLHLVVGVGVGEGLAGGHAEETAGHGLVGGGWAAVDVADEGIVVGEMGDLELLGGF